MIPLIRFLVIMVMYILSLLYTSQFGVSVTSVFATLSSAALAFLIFPCITKTRD